MANAAKIRESQARYIGLAVTISVLAAICYGLYHVFAAIEKEIAVATLAGTFTVIASVCSFLISKYVERNREIEREVREKKIPFYDGIIRLFFESVFSPESIKKKKSSEEITKEMQNFSV